MVDTIKTALIIGGMNDVNARQTLAANIRRELKARKWRQSDLAEKLKWPQSRVAEVLNSDHSPRLDTVEVIANAFGVTPSALLMPVSENSPAVA
jgi:transcriptional regulator with XRE-family HTH domain